MNNFARKHLYLVLVILLLGLLTSVVHAAQLDVDTFDVDAQISNVDFSDCTSVGGGTGTDMMGGERDLLVTRTTGGGTVQADVDTSIADSLALSIGAGTRGTALVQLDGVDGNCALNFGLTESLNPYDGLTIFVRQVDLNGILTMRVYTDGSNYSTLSYTLPYAISPPGTEVYFPFAQFTDVGAGADFANVTAIEIILDGTTTDSLDMTIDYVSSDYTRDFGDLPSAYNNTLEADNGARHRLGGFYHFGTTVDSEADGQESVDATGDVARTDDETGITRDDMDWGDGTGAVFVDITKPGSVSVACVVGWIDWDGDNVFESTATVGTASELVTNAFVPGDSNISFTSPTVTDYGGTYPSTLNTRWRIFQPNDTLFTDLGLTLDLFGCPTSSTPAAVTQLVFGEAADGEVEDYQWGFGPTAITLSKASTSTEDVGMVIVLALVLLALVATSFYLRRQITT